MNSDYYEDLRWCRACGEHVHYLYSTSGSFCTRCGGRVTLFSDEERRAFQEDLRRASRYESREPA